MSVVKHKSYFIGVTTLVRKVKLPIFLCVVLDNFRPLGPPCVSTYGQTFSLLCWEVARSELSFHNALWAFTHFLTSVDQHSLTKHLASVPVWIWLSGRAASHWKVGPIARGKV